MNRLYRDVCLDNPEALLRSGVCLSTISKDVEGEIQLLENDVERCDEPRCETLKAATFLRLEVAAHDRCDAKVSSMLDGVFYVRDLAFVFDEATGEGRGLHAGTFRWRGQGAIAEGTLSGVTNAGTHRPQAFDECQECRAVGFMEGRFCGSVLRAEAEELVGCWLAGAYRLRFDPSEEGPAGGVSGVLEGALVCRCGVEQCTTFRDFAVGPKPSPWTTGYATYVRRDHTGAPTGDNAVVNWGGHTGLNCGFQLDIQLAIPSTEVKVGLVHFSEPATVEAFSGSSVVDTGSMSGPQNVVEQISLTGTGIDRVVVTAPEDEALLVELCFR